MCLSRGYGRKSRGVRLVDPSGLAAEYGDEPLLIAGSFRRRSWLAKIDTQRGVLRNPGLGRTCTFWMMASSIGGLRVTLTSFSSRRRMLPINCFRPEG